MKGVGCGQIIVLPFGFPTIGPGQELSADTLCHSRAAVSNGKYRYREHLLALQACKPEIPKTIPNGLEVVCSPLSERVEEWKRALEGHPDKPFCHYILIGLSKGFRIGFDYTSHCGSAQGNLISAEENPEVVQDYIQRRWTLVGCKGLSKQD